MNKKQDLRAIERREHRIDESLKETFPASDAPRLSEPARGSGLAIRLQKSLRTSQPRWQPRSSISRPMCRRRPKRKKTGNGGCSRVQKSLSSSAAIIGRRSVKRAVASSLLIRTTTYANPIPISWFTTYKTAACGGAVYCQVEI